MYSLTEYCALEQFVCLEETDCKFARENILIEELSQEKYA